MSGISLWLSPPSPSPLPNLLSHLSTTYNTPSFSPHLTLLSDQLVPSGYSTPDLLAAIQRAVRKWHDEGKDACEIKFEEVIQGDKFYQCVFIKCAETSSLVSLHLALRKEFSLPAPTKEAPYFPHLSLVYGDLEREKKSEIIKKMEQDGEVKGEEVVGVKEFRPSEILVMRTKGPPKEWEFIGRVDLGSGGGGVDGLEAKI
ncbi:LigT-like protein [Atractiella rhizophila]|nr:LigT-like protein [Atractiella rhizophila]